MAKKKPEVKTFSREELIEKVFQNWLNLRTSEEVIPEPSYTFKVGEQVKVGRLSNVIIEKILFNGKAYIYSCTWTDRDNPNGYEKFNVDWWYDISPFQEKNEDIPRLTGQYRIFQSSSSDIDSIMHHMSAGGLVIDPLYQRGYVWSEENKDALIESILEGLDIGSFLFVRHHGYLHNGSEEVRNYKTLDGRDVSIKAEDDFTVAIVDGQQRFTTIWEFVNDVRPYKGIYFSQLHWRDKIEFMQKSVTFKIINEEQTTPKEVLRMFLQSNRGVPQSPEHLEKIQKLYESMT